MENLKYIKIDVKDSIAIVTLNNPKKTNAINEDMWREIGEAFNSLNELNHVNVAILKSDAKHFSSGIDLGFITSIMDRLQEKPEAERPEALYQQIKVMQSSINAVQDCRVPVIAAIHGICVGGAIDLIAACDMRISTFNSIFSILETKLGIVADMGTLQRLPKVMSDTHLKHLALTSDFFSGYKAKKLNLVSSNHLNKISVHKAAIKLATKIAKLPTNAVQGTKASLNYARENTVADGLEQIAKVNSTLLLSEQTVSALDAVKAKLQKSN